MTSPFNLEPVPTISNTVHNTRLVSRDEQELVDARKEFYKNAGTDKVFLKTGEWIGKTGIPLFVAFFSFFYWGYGVSTLYKDDLEIIE